MTAQLGGNRRTRQTRLLYEKGAAGARFLSLLQEEADRYREMTEDGLARLGKLDHLRSLVLSMIAKHVLRMEERDVFVPRTECAYRFVERDELHSMDPGDMQERRVRNLPIACDSHR